MHFNGRSISTRNKLVCQGRIPWEKNKKPWEMDVCQGFCQGLNPWEKRPSQISLPGISSLAKKRGAGPGKIPGKIPVKIPVLAPVFSLTHLHTFLTRCCTDTSQIIQCQGFCQGQTPVKRYIFF